MGAIGKSLVKTWAEPAFPHQTPLNIEGSIWEYTGTPKSEVGKTDVPSETISGRFRIEGNAVFDVRLVGVLPPRDKVRRVAEKLKRGEGVELRLPEPPQQKRIGE